MPEFSCSHYYTYDEITALLQGWETEYGAICELSSIGTSLEGRELWLLTGAAVGWVALRELRVVRGLLADPLRVLAWSTPLAQRRPVPLLHIRRYRRPTSFAVGLCPRIAACSAGCAAKRVERRVLRCGVQSRIPAPGHTRTNLPCGSMPTRTRAR